MDARLRERQRRGVAASHRGLDAMLDELAGRGALDPAAPSLLPGWTVGHVLTHLARNADSMTYVLATAGPGDVVERYVGGAAGRNADIDAGAGRAVAEQLADVRRADADLDAAFAAERAWAGRSLEVSGQVVPVDDLVFLRWREVEVHRVDLGVGYGPSDWPAEYVRTELVAMEMRWRARRPMGLSALPPEALAAPEPVRVAWLLGRAEIDGLGPAGVF